MAPDSSLALGLHQSKGKQLLLSGKLATSYSTNGAEDRDDEDRFERMVRHGMLAAWVLDNGLNIEKLS
jgi:hypothetical protein